MKTWLLVLLLCVAIPVQAWATLSQRSPCPMQAGSAPAGASRSVDTAAAAAADDSSDCCNDADTAALTGQACKAGQACGTPAPAPATLQAVIAVNQPSNSVAAGTDAPSPPGMPSPVWRPPMAR